jgi:hypothetical protein
LKEAAHEAPRFIIVTFSATTSLLGPNILPRLTLSNKVGPVRDGISQPSIIKSAAISVIGRGALKTSKIKPGITEFLDFVYLLVFQGTQLLE